MAWIILGLAGLCEVGFTTAMKYADGFTKLMPSLVFAVLYIASAILLAQAVKTLPLGTAYAVWTGIGAVGTAIIGIIIFGDPASLARLFFLSLIVVGIVGLKTVSA
ncbi:MAG: multidrug efflux SMR transporter [Alphaproteobacteria bacterium]|jgi:quaternary ammonium compound-resistance protein SugE|nr:multidrug efflux SMR transporter [Alphaproteobacteria bacterium]PHX99445.1 MAG: QacE family quaternary ammonium compound efflux SMR transporter [Rhodospirillaceae bacterium]